MDSPLVWLTKKQCVNPAHIVEVEEIFPEVYSVKLTLSNNGVYHTIRVKLDELTPSGKNLLRLTDEGEKRFAMD